MKKLPIVLGAALLLSTVPGVAPARAAETETRVEEHTEEDGDERRTERTVESERESALGAKSVERKETVERDGDDVKKTTEETVEHSDDD